VMSLPSALRLPSSPVPLLQRRTQTTPHAGFLNSVPRQCILLQHRKRSMPEATNCCIHILSRQINHPLSPKRFILTVLYIIGPVGIFWASNQRASLAKGLQLHMHPSLPTKFPPSWLAPQLVPTKRTLPWSLNKNLRTTPFPLYRVYCISQTESCWIFPADLQKPSNLRTPRTETISDSLPGTPKKSLQHGTTFHAGEQCHYLSLLWRLLVRPNPFSAAESIEADLSQRIVHMLIFEKGLWLLHRLPTSPPVQGNKSPRSPSM
jgi:hypothetical protein